MGNSWSNDVKQRYFNIYNVYTTLFQRRFTMMCPLGECFKTYKHKNRGRNRVTEELEKFAYLIFLSCYNQLDFFYIVRKYKLQELTLIKTKILKTLKIIFAQTDNIKQQVSVNTSARHANDIIRGLDLLNN